MTVLAHTDHFPVIGTGSLQSYLDSVQQIPILSAEEEVLLFEQFKEQEDLEAARKLVLSHLRYVVYVARGYAGYGLPLDDLIQQGNAHGIAYQPPLEPFWNVLTPLVILVGIESALFLLTCGGRFRLRVAI